MRKNITWRLQVHLLSWIQREKLCGRCTVDLCIISRLAMLYYIRLFSVRGNFLALEYGFKQNFVWKTSRRLSKSDQKRFYAVFQNISSFSVVTTFGRCFVKSARVFLSKTIMNLCGRSCAFLIIYLK